MDALWLLNARTLKFERRLLTSTQLENSSFLCIPVHVGAVYHMFAYTVWYVWQLKFLALRQYRKLVDGAAKNGRIFVLNHSLTKELFCSCAWLKLAILTSPRAPSTCDEDG